MVPCHGAVSRGLFLTWSGRIWQWSTIPCPCLCTQHHLCILNMVSLDRPRYVFVLRLTSRFGPLASKKTYFWTRSWWWCSTPRHHWTRECSTICTLQGNNPEMWCGKQAQLNDSLQMNQTQFFLSWIRQYCRQHSTTFPSLCWLFTKLSKKKK